MKTRKFINTKNMSIPEYCYIKKYQFYKPGLLELTNAEEALLYIESKVNILSNITTHEEEIMCKLEIFREFMEIYKYDCKTAILPELIGTFKNNEEKQILSSLKLLIEDFGLYLGGIFCRYHIIKAQNTNSIPILTCPRFIVNYDELYLKAVNEYFATLLRTPYAFNMKGVFVDNRQIIEEPRVHSVGTTFILPVLIEHFLIIHLQNSILKKAINKLKVKVDNKEISLNTTEEQDYKTFMEAIKLKSAIINGNQKQTMLRLYRLFIKTGVLDDNRDNQLILVGEYGNVKITLGAVLNSKYAKRVIHKEYFDLITILFESQKMNIRNCIMHGNNATYDYLAIGIASVMLQLLWDIAYQDIFNMQNYYDYNL